MAISTFPHDVSIEATSPKAQISPNSSKNTNMASRRLVKINFAEAEDTITSPKNKYCKLRKNGQSPYLTGDSLHLISRVTEKTYLHKRGSEFSSFPLAKNLYRANSDEIKNLKNSSRKVKKSVLTLPNDPAPQPQLCTVSDINDSEICNKDSIAVIKPKKRIPIIRHKKNRSKFRDFEFYDRDAGYILDLDCSATDNIINHYNGDGSKPKNGSNKTDDDSVHDVWAVLRNINRFQFRPSPPMSEDSFVMPVKKKGIKRRNNRKDLRVVETCHTEQIAYIADFDVESRSPKTASPTSSFDRITVVEKQKELGKVCKAFQKVIFKPNKGNTNNRPRIENIKTNKKKYDRPVTRKTNHLSHVKNKNVVKYIDKQIFGDNEFNNGFMSSEDSHVQDYFSSSNCDHSHTIYDSTAVKNTELEINCSDHSGSSKAARSSEHFRECTNKNDLRPSRNPSPSAPSQQATGITKVVLNKGKKGCSPDRISIEPRVNTRVNNPMPKLNKIDIKRRVAKLTFPIIVLGKDQLSSSYEVVEDVPDQFNGLDETFWPYMLDWYGYETETEEPQPNNNRVICNKTKRLPSFMAHKKAQKIINNFSKDNTDLSVNKKNIVESKYINRNRAELKRITPPHELSNHIQKPMNLDKMLQQPAKQKPMRQFKDKMLRFLYKKQSLQSIVDDENAADEQYDLNKKANQTKVKTIDVGLDTPWVNEAVNMISVPIEKPQTITKHSWSKARWASDFIENVIRKIKTGVYYTNTDVPPILNRFYECKASNTNPEMKEVSIQTITSKAVATSCDSMQSISKVTIKNKFDPLMVIPGFEDDNLMPNLEIETMSMNEISVKHCTTKILLQFDVASPMEPLINLKKSSSLIPLTVTESQTKVFKCKTTIVNAMLPEELCTLLPKMMTNIIRPNERLDITPVLVDKPDFYLFPIQEMSRSESPETISHSLLPVTRMSPKLQTLLDGLYSSPKKLKHTPIVPFDYCRSLPIKLLPCLERPNFFNCNVNPVIFICISRLKSPVIELPKVNMNTCMALMPYFTYDRRIIPAYKRFDLAGILLKMFNIRDRLVYCLHSKPRPWADIALNNITLIKLTVLKPNGLKDSIVYDFTTPNNANKTSNEVSKQQKNFVNKYWRLTENNNTVRNDKNKNDHMQLSVLNNKLKKKGFVKMYRKCKSSSSISGEMVTIPLSRINNLEDFFAAFGTGKILAGAFDRQGGQKILSAVAEMTKWAKDINPRQALLVILLNNKKDTPNLVRFKPVLLQGIAMNRITRANELDMEIEVIERENLCRLTQYEGISYLPASAENQNTLFEELCWIAKNTASDYHRAFDESSEKLLKSLLQKRKRLNPSYLRVMARYVGLGLLKSPKK